MLKLALLSLAMGLCSAYKYHSIELPIKSSHELKVIHSPSYEDHHSTYVDVPGGVLPVYLLFKTQSSPVYVKQEHKGTKGSYQKSDSHDEPHRLVHEVVKPVIQELKEVITPYRKVIQVIEPVREERLTKVHKNEGKSYGSDGGYGGSDGGYGKDSGYGLSGGYGQEINDYKMEEYKAQEYNSGYY